MTHEMICASAITSFYMITLSKMTIGRMTLSLIMLCIMTLSI
jgi:hypothetical protein